MINPIGRIPRHLLIDLLCLLLGACAAPRSLPTGDFEQLQDRLRAIQSWQVDGKIGLQQNGRGSSARVNWRQDLDQFSLRLSGPMGIGTVLVDGNDNGVEVRNKDGVFQADSPEQLLLELTGWHIPVSELRYWARGMAAPGMPVDQRQVAQGRLASLSQGGWHIEYRDYSLVEGIWLPARMLMSRPETQITLLYKSWQLLTHQ